MPQVEPLRFRFGDGGFLRTKLHNDRFEAVMAARSTAGPQSQAAKRQRHIIKHHKNLGWLDLVKLRYSQERVATPVHVAHWFCQKHIAAFGH